MFCGHNALCISNPCTFSPFSSRRMRYDRDYFTLRSPAAREEGSNVQGRKGVAEMQDESEPRNKHGESVKQAGREEDLLFP